MSAVLSRVVARLLASAARRWPPSQRDDLAREWAAEVHTLANEPGVTAPVRSWRQLRFAASLALARPPGAEPAPLSWLRRPSPARTQAGWLLSAPLLAMLAAPVTLVPLLLIPFGRVTFTPTTMVLFSIETYAVEIGLAMLVGTVLARRFLRRRAGQPAGVAACAWATLPVIGGLLFADGLARTASQVWVGGWFAVIAAGCLVVLLPPAAAGAAALSHRRRRGWTVVFAGLSAVVVTAATTYVIVLLTPQSSSPAVDAPWWWFVVNEHDPYISIVYTGGRDQLPVELALAMMPGLVLTTVVVALAHAIRLARPLSAAKAVAPNPGSGPRAASKIPPIASNPWWQRTALAGATYSVLAWAVTLTYLTPNIGVQSSWPSRIRPDGRVSPVQPGGWPEWSSEENRLWMHELQLTGIVCAALCLACAAAYRGRPVLPALAGSGLLLAVNVAVVREGWTDPRLLPWLAGGGLVVGLLVWHASVWRGTRRPPRRPHRLVIAITVLAAYLVPGSFFPRWYVGEQQAPPVLLVVVVGLPTLLTGLAAMGVLATSPRRPPGPAWLLPAGLATLVAIGGVLYYQEGAAPYFLITDSPLSTFVFVAPLMLAVPAAAGAIIAIRGRVPYPARLGWHMLCAVLLLVAGFVVAMATTVAASLIARLVLYPMEYGQTYDGVAYVPGAVVIGLLLGSLAASRLDRSDVRGDDEPVEGAGQDQRDRDDDPESVRPQAPSP